MKDIFYLTIILLVSWFSYHEYKENKYLQEWDKETVTQCVQTIAISHDICLKNIEEFLGNNCDKN